MHLLQAQELLNPSLALQTLIHVLLLTNLASVSSGFLLAPEATTPNNLAVLPPSTTPTVISTVCICIHLFPLY